MGDLGPAWAAQGVPRHPLDDDDSEEDASL
jgi:hypothetical protein